MPEEILQNLTVMAGKYPHLLAAVSPKLKLFQDSFTNYGRGHYLAGFWIVFGIILLLVLGMVLWQWCQHLMKKNGQRTQADHLFFHLLNQLDLTQTERKIVAEVVAGARLQHPVMCMLSPAMMRSACQIWYDQGGSRKSKLAKMETMDTVCWKIFSQRLAS